MLGNIAKAWFGNFTADELKKFTKLGVIFGLVIGVYWTLRPLKDSIFQSMAHQDNQPWAKLLSLVVLFPLVIIYSKVVDKVPRYKMFYILGTIYAVGTLVMGLLFMHPTIGLANTQVDPSRILAWVWYVFVESYGSLVVALFWAFAADTTSPEAAKRGFPFVVMIGQLGSIVGPLKLVPLSRYFGNSAPVVMICGGLIVLMMVGVAYFMATTPKEQLTGFSSATPTAAPQEHKEEPGFFEGLKLLVSKKYLLGIFAVIGFFELITTIIDFNFKCKVASTFALEADRACYLGDYAVWVNIVAFLSLLFGVSNIQRRLGIRVSLVLMPLVVLGMVLSFWFAPNIQTLFWIMVVAKAMNYALNGPALKQLYIPTSKEAKYKAQAWIETFGSRGSKGAGASFNLLKKPFTGMFGAAAGEAYMIALGAYLAFGLIAAWLLVALYLGKTYDKAVHENKVVC